MKNFYKYLAVAMIFTVVLSLCVLAGCRRTAALHPAAVANDLTEQPNLLMSVGQLKELIDSGEENLILIGVINPSAELVPSSPSSTPIEGSFLVWRGDYCGGGSTEAAASEVTGFRRSQAEMESLLSRAGATQDSKIIVYSADAMHDAARFVWQLKMLGLKDVNYLDGGINAWIAAGYPTGSGVRLAEQPPVVEFSAPDYAPWEFDVPLSRVREALLNPDEWVVIDTRSREEFAGRQTGSSAGAFGTGRIKGAINISWIKAVDQSTLLIRSKAELKAIYGSAIKDKNVIVFCQSGARSAHTWLVLTQVLGAANVYNYNGSWIEWSFAASEASDGRFPGILELTEVWRDNRRPI